SQMENPTLNLASPDLQYSAWSASNGADEGSLGINVSGGINWLRKPDGDFERVGIGSLGESPGSCPDRITPGGGHIIFRTGECNGSAAPVQLEPDAPSSPTQVVYDRTPGGSTQVVSLLPGDVTPSANASYIGSSTDGTAIAFAIQGDPSLYVRLNNTTTLQVTASANTFEGLAGDGSAVFYLQGGDLYRYDTNSQQATQITNTGDFSACLAQRFPVPHPSCVVNIPEDGHHAYFSSQSVLAAGGVAGKDNLYYWDGSSVGL